MIETSRRSVSFTRRWCRVLSAPLVLLSIVQGVVDARAQAMPSRPDAIADTFVQLTLRAEFSKGGADQSLALTKWEKPISWTLLGNAPPAFAPQVEAVLQEAARLTGQRVVARYVAPVTLRGPAGSSAAVSLRNGHLALHFDSRTREKPVVATFLSEEKVVAAAANLLVLYGDRSFLKTVAQTLPRQPPSLADDIASGRANCLAYTWTTPGRNDVAHAVVLIPQNLTPAVTTACLWEELGQVLGIRNDLEDADYSIFTNRLQNKAQRWTPFDERVIRMLYDPALEPGVRVGQVRQTLQLLIPKYFDDLQR